MSAVRLRCSIVLASLVALAVATASTTPAATPKPAAAKPGGKCAKRGAKVRDLVCTPRAGKLLWVATPSKPGAGTARPGPSQGQTGQGTTGQGGQTGQSRGGYEATCGGKSPPLLKTIGVEIGPYDPATETAGAFRFTRERLAERRLFMAFGHTVESSPSPKANPQPTFVLPPGTPVVSMIDGVVWKIAELWSTPTLGDVSVMVAEQGGSQPCFTIELEHVINPRVRAGDRVRAGQVLAEVGPLSKDGNAGMGLVEIGILTGGPDGRPHHLCPFAYLDLSVRTRLHGQIRDLLAAWETYRGDQTLYDEGAWVDGVPGCLATDIGE